MELEQKLSMSMADTFPASGRSGPSTWTPERVDMLREIWPKGYSASQMANMIGGVSRCAVLGKAHRLMLDPRAKDGSGVCKVRSEPTEAEKQKARDRNAHNKRVLRAKQRGAEPPEFKARTPMPEVAPAPPYAGSLKLPFAVLTGSQCRFIEGDAPEFLSCGNEVHGGSWCAYHQQIVWVAPERRRATSYDANRRGRKVSNFVGSFEPA